MFSSYLHLLQRICINQLLPKIQDIEQIYMYGYIRNYLRLNPEVSKFLLFTAVRSKLAITDAHEVTVTHTNY